MDAVLSPQHIYSYQYYPLGNRNPFASLPKVVSKGEYPRLLHPKEPKGKQVAICLNSSFDKAYKCKDRNTCLTAKWMRAKARERLHIDLSDPQWSSESNPEENWKPMIQFIQKYHTQVLPSEAFKRLTLSTTW